MAFDACLLDFLDFSLKKKPEDTSKLINGMVQSLNKVNNNKEKLACLNLRQTEKNFLEQWQSGESVSEEVKDEDHAETRTHEAGQPEQTKLEVCVEQR
jgi:hypothetical protein